MTDLISWHTFFVTGSGDNLAVQFLIWLLMIGLLMVVVRGPVTTVKRAPDSMRSRSKRGR